MSDKKNKSMRAWVIAYFDNNSVPWFLKDPSNFINRWTFDDIFFTESLSKAYITGYASAAERTLQQVKNELARLEHPLMNKNLEVYEILGAVSQAQGE